MKKILIILVAASLTLVGCQKSKSVVTEGHCPTEMFGCKLGETDYNTAYDRIRSLGWSCRKAQDEGCRSINFDLVPDGMFDNLSIASGKLLFDNDVFFRAYLYVKANDDNSCRELYEKCKKWPHKIQHVFEDAYMIYSYDGKYSVLIEPQMTDPFETQLIRVRISYYPISSTYSMFHEDKNDPFGIGTSGW